MSAEPSTTNMTTDLTTLQTTIDQDRNALRRLPDAFVAVDSPAGVKATSRLLVGDVVALLPHRGAIESEIGVCRFMGDVLADVPAGDASPRPAREACR